MMTRAAMLCVRRLVWAVVWVLVFASAATGDYTESVACMADALDALERGCANEALGYLRQVLEERPDDAPLHVALGYALLIGGRREQAVSEFETALRIDPGCALALYGRGIVFLAERSYEEAENCFREAQSLAAGRDFRSTLEYVRAVRAGLIPEKGFEKEAADRPMDEAGLALCALGLMKDGNYDEAAEIWLRLQSAAARQGYGERPGCTMTFLVERPVALTGEKIPSSARDIVAPAQAVKTVKGKIKLRADLRNARLIRMVTFSVDDKLLGVTNRPPFECIWDTTRWTNGPHSVKIVGLDELGAVVSEKSVLVNVDNPKTTSRDTGGEEQVKLVWDRLWSLMMLKPSSAAINYHLSVCARRGANTEMEKAALERVVAADPSYKDASRRLGELYRRGCSGDVISSLGGARKAVALTFDDGPKPETALLLDVLKSKGVKATFFVVGKQCERYPEILKRICEEGHALGNHTYSHSALEYLPPLAIEKEIFGCQAAVRDITGREMRAIRPPGAHFGERVKSAARKFGLKVVLFSANCSKVEGTTAERVIRYAIASAKPGAILLMHNLDRVTLQALPRVIDELRAKGYDFVTL
ncbi:MAG: polysaccharide deacetylase family protein [Armatimonadota bacterium]|nr:polysaccharide deacetylase family protein [Armatimonadota bacterium]